MKMYVLKSMRSESRLRFAPQDYPYIVKITIMTQFDDMTSMSKFFKVAVFLLSSLVTGPSFMPTLLLVLKL